MHKYDIRSPKGKLLSVGEYESQEHADHYARESEKIFGGPCRAIPHVPQDEWPEIAARNEESR